MEDKRFTLFGTDLEKIPCFKRTFTVSIYTGLAVGLGHLLFTSKVKRSTDLAMLSFTVTTLGYWIYCRYNWSKEYATIEKLNKNLHGVMITQGVKPP
ncbi:hypothetical protein JTE90_022702 [Oedothorax gibbosus]|uniref:Cytochrome c oxidase assembly protein COX20, mitochondrial n=1 Tax=Oedothorax gibbosus TaxID=931172 RepID=A0AAV6UK42_9ARAC|nr:hypothetical protein JTE90_022702 [Oedothorax gibbosus]